MENSFEAAGPFLLPAAHDACSARLIERAGFSFDLAKFDQSCFHMPTFRWLDLEGKTQGF